MKQTLKFILLAVLSITLLSACSDDDDDNNGKNYLPETARAFLQTRLPGYEILKIEKVDDQGNESNEMYVVTLSNDITISFSSLGYWRRIESNKELPELVRKELYLDGNQEVKNKYPSNTINKMYFLPYLYKVTLDNGVSLLLYNDDGKNMRVGVDMTSDVIKLPENARNFLTSYYSESAKNQWFYILKEDERDGDGYRFGLANATKVYFDAIGNWYYVGGSSWSLSDKHYRSLIPDHIRTLLEEKYKAGSSTTFTVVKYDIYYKVLIKLPPSSNSPQWILYDDFNKKEVEAPEPAVLSFLKSYIGEPEEKMVLTSTISESAIKEAIFKFTGKTNGTEVMSIYTDVYGQMRLIHLAGSEVPRKVLDYLPANVKSFVNINIPATDPIMEVANGLNGQYYVFFKSHLRLKYDAQGNILN